MVAVLLALTAQVASPLPADGDDIIVIGKRFAQTAVIVGKDDQGHFTCRITATNGNPQLDYGLCRTASKCVIKGAASNDDVKACVERKKPGLFEQFKSDWLKERHP